MGSNALDKLIFHCQPATFGYQDENYYKAGKMESDTFSTHFCPYQCGIVDVVSQILVPRDATRPQPARQAQADPHALRIRE